MIQDWYRCNGWQYWTLASWAESAGFHAIPYGRIPDIFGGTAGELSRHWALPVPAATEAD
jgi:hypothetical protein